MNRKRTWIFLLAGYAALLLGGAPAREETGRSELAPLMERFRADRLSLERHFGFRLLPVRRERQRVLLQETGRELGNVDFGALSLDGQIDYLLLRDRLARLELDLRTEEAQLAECAPLLPVIDQVANLEAERRQMKWTLPQKAADVLHDLSLQLQARRRELEKGSAAAAASRLVAFRASEVCDELRRVLKSWYDFCQGYDPLFTWWVAAPYRDLDNELKVHAEFLSEKLAGIPKGDRENVVGSPIGREALREQLRLEWIAYSPEELIEIGRREMAWCEAEMVRAARDLGCGDDWHAALEKVKRLHAPPGGQPELIRTLALEAVDFLESRDLITIPALAKESWHIEMLSAEEQLFNPFFSGGPVISLSFPTAEMAHPRKLMSLRGNNRYFARATVFHELIPGHHLVMFMAERFRTYRRFYDSDFFGEGWPLYWEMQLYDLGFARTPEERLGMLFWRIHRCGRIIFSLSFHLGRMSAQECIDFLVERIGHERENAVAEVRRSLMGGYDPLYQCAYMVGGLQLRALKKELVDGGRMTLKAFHDAALLENGLPIELLRAKLTGLPLNRDAAPAWRFYPR